MKLLLKVLGPLFCFPALHVAGASVIPIVPAPCLTLPLPPICTYQAGTYGRLALTAGNNTYDSGITSSQPYKEVQSDPVGKLKPIISEASGSFDVGFGGMHASLDAYGQYSSLIATGVGASGSFSGLIFDALATTTYAPGYVYEISVTVNATGNTVSHPLGQGDIFSSQVELSFSGGNSLSCSNGTAGNLRGTFSSTCVLGIPITGSLAEVATPFSIAAVAFVNSINGDDTLDMSHTLQIDSIQIVDSSGNVVPDAVIYDASGFDYNAQQPLSAPTPEPSSIALMATGVIAMFCLSRRRVRS